MGIVGRPHGLDGTVVVHPETDHPARFGPGSELQTDRSRRLTVRSAQAVEEILLVRFREIGDREGAEALRGALLTIDIGQRRDLGDDEFWPEDLVGLQVRDPAGVPIGSVVAVDIEAPQARLTIATSRGDFPVPLVTGLVPMVDLAGGFLVVAPIAGLFDD